MDRLRVAGWMSGATVGRARQSTTVDGLYRCLPRRLAEDRVAALAGAHRPVAPGIRRVERSAPGVRWPVVPVEAGWIGVVVDDPLIHPQQQRAPRLDQREAQAS